MTHRVILEPSAARQLDIGDLDSNKNHFFFFLDSRLCGNDEMENIKKYRTGFMGTPEFAVASLQALIQDGRFEIKAVITQPDRPIGRSKEPQPSPVKKAALEAGLTAITPAKVKGSTELFNQLKALNLDAIVVVAYGKILPQEILDIPKMGVVNVHGSTLPKYRGASPIAGAILSGDAKTGVTIMKLDPEMDTGPIIGISEPVKIAANDTTATLSTKLSLAGAQTLLKCLPDYLEGKITPTPQDETQATYTKLITKEDGQINWNGEAAAIERQIRAYQPWPGAFTQFKGKLLKILRAETIAETHDAGKAWKTLDEYPAIGTKAGSLKLLEVQLEGKKSTSGVDFLRGHPQLLSGLI